MCKCKGPTYSKTNRLPCKCIVTKIEDHKPIDGPIEKNAIAILSCGQWEFVWNLNNVQKEQANNLIKGLYPTCARCNQLVDLDNLPCNCKG